MKGVWGGGAWGSYAQQRTAEDLEEGNDSRVEGLSAKVKMLKDVSQYERAVYQDTSDLFRLCADHNWHRK